MCPGQTLSCPVLAGGPGPSCSTEIFLEWESVPRLFQVLLPLPLPHPVLRLSLPSAASLLFQQAICAVYPHHLMLSPGRSVVCTGEWVKFSTIIVPVPGSHGHIPLLKAMCGQ